MRLSVWKKKKKSRHIFILVLLKDSQPSARGSVLIGGRGGPGLAQGCGAGRVAGAGLLGRAAVRSGGAESRAAARAVSAGGSRGNKALESILRKRHFMPK